MFPVLAPADKPFSMYGKLRMRRWITSSLLLMALLLVTSCRPVDQHVLKLGATNWLGYQPFYVAQSLGYWQRQEINVVELGSTIDVLRALYTGGLDAAALPLDEVISVLAQGRDIKALQVLDMSYGRDSFIADTNIDTLADLKGKRIALENSALGTVMLETVLDKAGMTRQDVELNYVTYDQHEHVLTSKLADAVITFEPVKTKLLAHGYHELFNTRDMQGQVFDVLVVSRQALDKYPDRLKKVMSGYFLARELILEKDKTILASLGKRTGLDTEAVLLGYEQLQLPSLEENKRMMQQCYTGFSGATETFMKAMLSQKLVEEPIDFSKVCHHQLINELQL